LVSATRGKFLQLRLHDQLSDFQPATPAILASRLLLEWEHWERITHFRIFSAPVNPLK
jgi:hypothetical protein